MKGQVSTEYVMVGLMITLLVLPTAYLVVSFSKASENQIRQNQINKFGNDVVKSAEKLYYQGYPAKIVLDETLPEGVSEIEILHDPSTNSNELIFKINLSGKNVEFSFPSKVNLAGVFPPESYNKGQKTVTLQAVNDTLAPYVGVTIEKDYPFLRVIHSPSDPIVLSTHTGNPQTDVSLIASTTAENIIALSIYLDNITSPVMTCTSSPCTYANTYLVSSHTYYATLTYGDGNKIIRDPSSGSSTFSISYTYLPASSFNDTPDPQIGGLPVLFTSSATDPSQNGRSIRLYICKDSQCKNCNSNTSSSNCWTISNTYSPVNPSAAYTCPDNSYPSGAGPVNYWAQVCNDIGKCSILEPGQATFTCNYAPPSSSSLQASPSLQKGGGIVTFTISSSPSADTTQKLYICKDSSCTNCGPSAEGCYASSTASVSSNPTASYTCPSTGTTTNYFWGRTCNSLGACSLISSENSFKCDATPPDITVSYSTTTQNPEKREFSATSNAQDIALIKIYVDGNIAKSCTGTPCASPQITFTAGTHTYYATAADTVGNTGRDPINGTKSFTI